MYRTLLSACVLSLAIGATAQATVIHDESADGDLSGAFGSPDVLDVSAGVNTIIAQMGANGDTGATNGSDADYFGFTLESGEILTSLTVDAYTFGPGNPNVSFLGYVADTAFGGQGGGDIDGSALFNAASGDILGDLAGGPLGPGTYSFWVQETSPNVVDYQLSFTIVPEPSSAGLVALGLASLVARRRSRTRARA